MKLYRNILDWEWYPDINAMRLYTHLLLTTNYKEKEWKGRIINPGYVITSLRHLSMETGLTVPAVRSALEKLKNSKLISVETTNRYTEISIIGWNETQTESTQTANETQTNSTPDANKTQTERKQNATTKESKESKERKESKKARREKKLSYGTFGNVHLTKSEMEQLVQEFGDYEKRIENLSLYMESTGKTYKNHYATICRWANKDKKDNPFIELLEKEKINDIKTDSTAFRSDFTVLP